MMAPLTSNERLQEAFSLALEDRSAGYSDLVSNANAILYLLRKRNGFKPFSGPAIRERLLYAESNTYIRYSGFTNLTVAPAELFNDAEWRPKLAAVTVNLSGEDILKNSGRNQLLDIFDEHISAAENELLDRFVEDVHSNGAASNQIDGLQKAIPTVDDAGVYGGIDRATATMWQTKTYDAQTDFVGSTQVNSASIKGIFDTIVINHSRGTKGPSVIVSAQEHYKAFAAATVGIQRITDENELGKLGFANLKYYGAGKSIDVVLEGGIGSAMPSNTTYFIDMASLRFRYHPDRNFVAFGGKKAPINQDALVQHIGFFGNMTMTNPQFMAKLIDSNPAALSAPAGQTV
jgi:hypothetical protein